MRISDWSSDVCSSDLIKSPSLARGTSPMAPEEGAASCRHRAAREGEPRLGLTARGEADPQIGDRKRSEERRVGKGSVRTCRSGWSPIHYRKNRVLVDKCKRGLMIEMKDTLDCY